MTGLKRQEQQRSLWVIKIGGSIISTRDDPNYLNLENVRLAARCLKKLAHPLIIVHGTGYLSKSFARNNQFLNRKILAKKKQIVNNCLLMLREIHLAVLKIFVNEGIHTISISPFTFYRYRSGLTELLHPEILQELLLNGYVPLIHGDLILDKQGNFRICSSDDLAASVIREFPADKLLFAADVPGVYPQDPRKFPHNKPFDSLDTHTLKKLSQLPDDDNDVSGAMPAKLKAINQAIEYFRECYIFDGRSPMAWNSLILLKKSAGTLILGKLLKHEE